MLLFPLLEQLATTHKIAFNICQFSDSVFSSSLRPLFKVSVFKLSYVSLCGSLQITIKRTEQNNPLGLEVQLHVPEMLCPSLSELGESSVFLGKDCWRCTF